MSERAIPTKRHFDSLQCLTNALHKKSFYLGSPGSSSPDESTCLGLCAWPRWLYIPLLLPPLETGYLEAESQIYGGSRLSVETGDSCFFRRNAETPVFELPLLPQSPGEVTADVLPSCGKDGHIDIEDACLRQLPRVN